MSQAKGIFWPIYTRSSSKRFFPYYYLIIFNFNTSFKTLYTPRQFVSNPWYFHSQEKVWGSNYSVSMLLTTIILSLEVFSRKLFTGAYYAIGFLKSHSLLFVFLIATRSVILWSIMILNKIATDFKYRRLKG